jgi:hypothetical protein
MTMGRISRTNRNFVVAYICLVGLPLLGLAGVLKAGHALTAPISVGGAWTLESSSATSLGQSLHNSVLTISQSGNELVVSLNNGWTSTGPGTLTGAAIEAALPLPATVTQCASDATLGVKATIDSKAEPNTMHGTMSVKGCALPDAELSYSAVRQSRPKKEAR